jgi:hypothetical protein
MPRINLDGVARDAERLTEAADDILTAVTLKPSDLPVLVAEARTLVEQLEAAVGRTAHRPVGP